MSDFSENMSKPVNAWWATGYGNWGDIANPYIIYALSNRKVRKSKEPGTHFCIGSIVGFLKDGAQVWGSGMLDKKHFPKPFPKDVQFHAVRGPLTRKALLKQNCDVPEIYGDPVHLLPYIYPKIKEPTTEVGIVPHYSDLPHLREVVGTDSYKILNVMGGFYEFLKEVQDCRRIISSSLHGLVLADAYGLPAAWMRLDKGERVVGGGYKFRDYITSTGRKAFPNMVKSDAPLDISQIKWLNEAKLDLEAFLGACPFSLYKSPGEIPSKDINVEEDPIAPEEKTAAGKTSVTMGDADKGSDKDLGRELVSIIMPVTDDTRPEWALEALKSICLQDYPRIECLIPDISSPAESETAIQDFMQDHKDEDVRFHHLKMGGSKLNAARNEALRQCTGDFICYLNPHDYLLPDSIEERVRTLRNDPALDFCYGISSIVDEQGREIGKQNEDWNWRAEVLARISRFMFDINSPLIRQSFSRRLGFWDECDYEGSEEKYLIRLKFDSTKAYTIDKSLCAVRKSSRAESASRQKASWLTQYKDLLFAKSILLFSPHDKTSERNQLALRFRAIARGFYERKDYRNAKSAMAESVLLRPKLKSILIWLAFSAYCLVRKS